MLNYGKCPKCAYERKESDTAPGTECPSCGLIFARYAERVPIAPVHVKEHIPKPQTYKHPIWLKVLFSCCVLTVAWIFGTLLSKSKPVYDEFNAQTSCESFIRDMLKAPSTADFAPHSDLRISGNGSGPWSVDGYVDAQNSFGAKLRNRYSCTIQFSGGRAQLISASVN